jgi:outer membrane usher protein
VRRRPRWLALLAGALSCLACSWVLAQVQPKADRLLPLEVTVNGATHGTWVLIEREGALYAPKDALDDWRVVLRPGTQPVAIGGVAHYLLSSVPGFTAKVDFAAQSLALSFAPQAFAATRVGEQPPALGQASPALPSAFLNYDLAYTTSRFRDARSVQSIGGLGEVGVSNALGVLTTSFVARTTQPNLGPPTGLTRLESTFTRDFPAERLTLRIGDTITQPGMLARSVYFGGVRLGTNFALAPGFLTQPVLSVNGLSAAPSTAELYVNDVLRQVSNVPTGPFTIASVPQFSGGGEVRVVVRDVLGRETVVTQPFFSSPQLLAPGLMDWSVESGVLRRSFGLQSAEYGRPFGSATARRGITNTLTVEGRAEASDDARAIGGGASFALPASFLGQAAALVSHHDRLGGGSQWLLGADRIGTRSGAGLQLQGGTRGFRQLGQPDSVAPIRLQALGNATYSSERFGTVGVGFAHLARWDDTKITTVSASYNLRVLEHGVLSFTYSRAVAGGSGTSVTATLSLPLDNRYLVSASTSTRQGRRDTYAAVSHSPGTPGSLAWRVLAGRGPAGPRAEGGLYYDGDKSTLAADVSNSEDAGSLRLAMSGALTMAGGKVFASRRVLESYAVVEVPGYPDVGVSLGSQSLGRTDKDGVAFIPRLLPYQRNSIRLDAQDLPVSAELDSIELEAVPPWRSGVRVTFPVRSGRGALLRIVVDGQPAPAGAVVRLRGDNKDFYVARRGEAFVTGLQDKNTLTLSAENLACSFEVVLPPPAADDIPRLGPFDCRQ